VIKEILETKDLKVRLAPRVLLDLLDLLDPQELTQQFLDLLDHKEQQDNRDLRVIKVKLGLQGQVETELHHQLTMETEPSHLPLMMELHLQRMI
tara:strand:- start:110 stop:391 length:282 start_codon:yes stop_codon:yes gene_type:complete